MLVSQTPEAQSASAPHTTPFGSTPHRSGKGTSQTPSTRTLLGRGLARAAVRLGAAEAGGHVADPRRAVLVPLARRAVPPRRPQLNVPASQTPDAQSTSAHCTRRRPAAVRTRNCEGRGPCSHAPDTQSASSAQAHPRRLKQARAGRDVAVAVGAVEVRGAERALHAQPAHARVRAAALGARARAPSRLGATHAGGRVADGRRTLLVARARGAVGVEAAGARGLVADERDAVLVGRARLAVPHRPADRDAEADLDAEVGRALGGALAGSGLSELAHALDADAVGTARLAFDAGPRVGHRLRRRRSHAATGREGREEHGRRDPYPVHRPEERHRTGGPSDGWGRGRREPRSTSSVIGGASPLCKRRTAHPPLRRRTHAGDSRRPTRTFSGPTWMISVHPDVRAYIDGGRPVTAPAGSPALATATTTGARLGGHRLQQRRHADLPPGVGPGGLRQLLRERALEFGAAASSSRIERLLAC